MIKLKYKVLKDKNFKACIDILMSMKFDKKTCKKICELNDSLNCASLYVINRAGMDDCDFDVISDKILLPEKDSAGIQYMYPPALFKLLRDVVS